MKRWHWLVLICLCGALAGQALTGCAQSSSGSMSAQDKANFKGGPMPPAAQKIFAEKLRQASQPGASAAPAKH